MSLSLSGRFYLPLLGYHVSPYRFYLFKSFPLSLHFFPNTRPRSVTVRPLCLRAFFAPVHPRRGSTRDPRSNPISLPLLLALPLSPSLSLFLLPFARYENDYYHDASRPMVFSRLREDPEGRLDVRRTPTRPRLLLCRSRSTECASRAVSHSRAVNYETDYVATDKTRAGHCPRSVEERKRWMREERARNPQVTRAMGWGGAVGGGDILVYKLRRAPPRLRILFLGNLHTGLV